MEYSSVTSSYEEYKSKAIEASKDESVVLISFADYGSAVFGHYLVPANVVQPANIGAGPRTDIVATAAEARSVRAEAVSKSPAIAFLPYGSPLSKMSKELSSLQDLLSALVPGSNVPFVEADLLCLADYSAAADGRSAILFVRAGAAMSSAPRALVLETLSKWRNDEWMSVLGLDRAGTASFSPSFVQGPQ